MSEISTFDGLDNRREVMVLLDRLDSDAARARFIEGLIPHSLRGFAGCPMRVRGNCDAVAAYFMLVGVCNELGVSIDYAARKLDTEITKPCHSLSRGVPRGLFDYPCGVCPKCRNVMYDSDFK